MGNGRQLGQPYFTVQMLVNIMQNGVELLDISAVKRLSPFGVNVIVMADNFCKDGLELNFGNQLITGPFFVQLPGDFLHQIKNAPGGGGVPVQPVGEISSPFEKNQQKIIIQIVG